MKQQLESKINKESEDQSYRDYQKRYKILQQQNQILLNENEILKKKYLELEKILDFDKSKQMMKHLNKNDFVMEKQLENAYKQIEIYKKQLKKLRVKTNQNNDLKIQQLNSMLKIKDKEIEILRNEIKTLNKIKNIHEKQFIQIAGDGVVQCWKDNNYLNEEKKKLQNKCQFYQRQLYKRSVSIKKPIQNQIQDDNKRNPIIQKQLEILKNQDSKNKKTIHILINEKNKLFEEIKELLEKIEEKDKQNNLLNKKIKQLRNIINTNKKNKDIELAPIKLNKTQQDQNQYNLNPFISIPNYTLKSRISLQKNKVLTEKKYKTIYPKKQQRGKSFQNSIKFSHNQFKTKIVQLHILLDSQNYINYIHAKYQNGQPTIPLQIKPQLNFKCNAGQFIQYISGGFGDKYLQFIVFVTNLKRLTKFGIQKVQCKKFDFNITEKEYPTNLFGEIIQQSEGQYRITKIGCYINSIQ